MILFLEVRLDYKCLNNLSASGNIKNRQSYLLFAMLCACVCVLNLTTGRYEERLWVVSGSWTHCNRVLQLNTHITGIKPQSLCLAVKQPVLPGSSPGCSLR